MDSVCISIYLYMYIYISLSVVCTYAYICTHTHMCIHTIVILFKNGDHEFGRGDRRGRNDVDAVLVYKDFKTKTIIRKRARALRRGLGCPMTAGQSP